MSLLNLAEFSVDQIELPYVTVRNLYPVIYFVYTSEVELGFPEIRELVECAEKLSKGKPYVTLSDIRGGIGITEEGKRYVANLAHMPLFRGTAVLVSNKLYEVAINFVGSFRNHKYPYRAFLQEEKAFEWLRSLPLE